VGVQTVWYTLFKAAALKLLALAAMVSPLAAPALATTAGDLLVASIKDRGTNNIA